MTVSCPQWSQRTVSCLLLACGLALVAGCATGPGTRTGTPQAAVAPDRWPTAAGTLSPVREGCNVLDGESVPGGTFVFVLTEDVAPGHAPVPRNTSERIVFAHLYETLVNVDCAGTVTAGLATNWTCTEDSTTWVFTLREDARFWDGSRVTAEDVRQAWTQNQGDPASSEAASPWNWINARAASITVLDARRLAVQLPEPQARFPLLMAHPAAAVSGRRAGWTWPVGSGPCRLRATDPAPHPELDCRPNLNHPRAPAWKSLVFRVQAGADVRDFATAGFDLAVTRELDAVEFFRAAPGYDAWALPWDRLYLLVCPPETNPAGAGRWLRAADGLQMPRDMPGVSARPWGHVMFPLDGGGQCPQLSGPITSRRATPLDSELERRTPDALTVVYPAHDTAAAELAGRLSHLAGEQTRTADFGPTDFDLALEWQLAGALVVAQDLVFPTGCLQLATLLGRAAWLQQAGLNRTDNSAVDQSLAQAERMAAGRTISPDKSLIANGTVRPLALTRRWLIARGPLAGLQLDFDGTPRLGGLGRPAGPEDLP